MTEFEELFVRTMRPMGPMTPYQNALALVTEPSPYYRIAYRRQALINLADRLTEAEFDSVLSILEV